MTHKRVKNILTPCCSNSWVRKVQLNYVNAEMNVLCRTSTGDTCRDCSDISSSKHLYRISLDVLNACLKNCHFVDMFFVFLHLACQRSSLITLTFIRAALPQRMGTRSHMVKLWHPRLLTNALVLSTGAAQLSNPDADLHRQHLLGCFGSLLTPF